MKSPLDDLSRVLPSARVLTGEADLSRYAHDHLGFRGTPAAVVRPRTTEDVAALLRLATERGFPVVPRAAATNLCGSVVPGERVVLDMTAMRRVVSVDAESLRATVEPGLLNGQLQEQLAPLGLCFSPDPASRPISTVGGNIATNAGGPGCIRYGVTFHHVHAVELVLPGGQVVELTDDDPVDLLGVVIGSEGTLGVVTRAVVRLRPVAAAAWTALASFDRVEDAALTVSEIIAARLAPSALELLDRRGVEVVDAWRPSGYPRDGAALLFAEVEGEPDEVAAQAGPLSEALRRGATEVRVAAAPAEREAVWAGRLGFGVAMVAGGKRNFVNDMSVPRQRIPEMIARARAIADRHDLDVPIVAHAGDGNVHPVILYEDADRDAVAAASYEMTEAALDLGGTITGEHGVGSDKVPHMSRRFSPAELGAFRAIKRAFDPEGILNPGILYPEPGADEPEAPGLQASVRQALSGSSLTPVPHDPGAGADDVRVDLENLTVEAGADARCEAVLDLLRSHGLGCDAIPPAGSVGEAVAAPEHRSAVRPGVLAIQARMPHGRVRFGSAAVKDVAGLDAKRLLAGTAGAFGRVERAVFRVAPRR